MIGSAISRRVATSAGEQISPIALFGIVYATSISTLYFALGVIARHANGLTPAVFVVAAVFFELTAMTYAEGASLHPERGGSAAFARFAFNELVSFVAGWAIALDYVILVAVAALTAPAYLSVFWPALGHGPARLVASLLIVALVGADALTGVNARRLRRRVLIFAGDLVVQALVIVLGLVLVFHPSHLTASVHLGSAPSASDLGFALPVGVIAFAGLESAANLAREASISREQVRRLLGPGALLIAVVYVGISIVGVAALPVHHGVTALGRREESAPLLGLVESFRPHGVADVLKYLVGISGAAGLVAAAGAAMLGVSRVGYALATNRQIPSAVGRLSGRWGTPWVVIAIASLAAGALVVPHDIELLVGVYAFGALTTFGLAHASVLRLRFREPDHDRPYRIPGSVRLRSGTVPLPAALGLAMAAAGWVALLVFHPGARYVGVGWLALGLCLYVGYRTSQGKPITRRVTIDERALKPVEDDRPEFGSILVPVFGNELDSDIIQTAGRLAGETRDERDDAGATIEAIWVFEIPMSLPLDGPLPEAQTDRARAALRRAREIGEEYENVEVATAMVRARRTGQAIVSEARRRGVELIVLAAEEPSRIRGGSLLGAAGPVENTGIGAITRYVIAKAPCRVVLTAPASTAPVRKPGTTPAPTVA